MSKKKLSKSQIDCLVKEIKDFLKKNGLEDGVVFYYGDITPTFEYHPEPNILSMSFEGPLYDLLNYTCGSKTEEKFTKILRKYGLYFELGNAWNLSCYEI